MLRLSKLSSPGWEKEFESYEQVYKELKSCSCKECNYEALVWCLMGTACGAEFDLEEVPE